jgi:hypothetical protein
MGRVFGLASERRIAQRNVLTQAEGFAIKVSLQ